MFEKKILYLFAFLKMLSVLDLVWILWLVNSAKPIPIERGKEDRVSLGLSLCTFLKKKMTFKKENMH